MDNKNKLTNQQLKQEEYSQMQGFEDNQNEEEIEEQYIDQHYANGRASNQQGSQQQSQQQGDVQRNAVQKNVSRDNASYFENNQRRVQTINVGDSSQPLLMNRGQKLNIVQAHNIQNIPNQQQAARPVYPQPQHITQQNFTRSKVTINGREPSPNRFYSQSQIIPIENRAVTPPKPVTTMSFGKLIPPPMPMSPNYQIPSKTQPILNSTHPDHSYIIRSRVISQRQMQPIGASQVIKPQSSIVPSTQRYELQLKGDRQILHIVNQQPSFIRNRAQFQTRSRILQANTTRQQSTSNSPNYVNQNRQIIINRPVPTLSHGFPSQTLSAIDSRRVSPTQVNVVVQPQHQLPVSPVTRPTSIPIVQNFIPISTNQITIRTLTRYENITVQIHSLTKSSHTITQLIAIMLRGQQEKKKQQFIQKLMNQHNVLQQNLNNISLELTKVEKQNKQLRNALFNQSNRLQTIQSTAQKPQQPQNSQQQKQYVSQLQQQLIKLRKSFQKLTTQHNDLQQKYQSIQQSTISVPTSQQPELLRTIQSQKQIIKKLQQQLLNIRNQPAVQITNVIENKQLIAAQSKYKTILDSKQAYINQLQAQILRHKTQIKSLKQQIFKQRSQRSLNMTGQQQSKTISQLNKQRSISSSNQNNSPKIVQKLQRVLKLKQQQLETIKDKIFEMQDQFQQALDQKQYKIKQLHSKIMLMTQQKNLSQLQQTTKLQTLTQNLKSKLEQKQKQLIQLQTQIKQKSSLQLQLDSIKHQNINLNQSLNLKVQEQQHLKQIVSSLQTKIKNDQQKNIMIQNLKKKQEEIIKMRQTIQLHLTSINQLTGQIDGLKEGYKAFQLQIQEERRASSQRVNDYQSKIKQLQKKNQAEHNAEQQQVQKLKKTIVDLQKNIKKFEQSQVQRISSPRKGDDGQDIQPDFRNQYSQQHIKIFELQADVKAKQNKIRQLQSYLETLKVKLGHNTQTQDDFLVNQEIDMLRKKIADYQSGAATGGAKKSYSFKNRDYETSNLFEQRIIYQLKEQNQRLKSMVNGYDRKPTTTRSPKKQLNIHQTNSLTNIQKRLYEFNQKLQQLLTTNRKLEHQHNPHMHLKPAPLNYQLFNFLQQQKQSIVKKYNREIQTLQSRLIDIQRYCAELQYQHTSQTTFGYTYIQKKTEENHLYAEQIVYYRSKNKELEDRVDVLLALNKQLKDKLEYYMKPQGQFNLEYYKKLNQQLKSKISDLQALIKSLTQQKTNLQAQIQAFKSDTSSQNLIQTLQHKVIQLDSIILRLQNQNNQLQNQLKKYTQQVINYSSQSFSNKSLISQYENKISLLERQIKKYDSKVWEKDQQITKLMNQIQLLKAEIQRLNQLNRNRNNDSEKQINKLKSKLNQYINKNKELQKKSVELQHDNHSKDQLIINLNIKIQNLQTNYRDQVQKVTSLTQKLRQLQSRFKQAEGLNLRLTAQNKQFKQLCQRQKDTINSLNNQLAQLRLQLDTLNSKYSKYDSRIAQLQQALQSVKQQSEQYRKLKFQLTQQNQQLQAQKLSLNKIIQSLKLRISQLELLNRKMLENMEYQIQLIRSIFVEVDVLIGQIRVEALSREVSIIESIRKQVQKGFGSCYRLQDVL